MGKGEGEQMYVPTEIDQSLFEKREDFGAGDGESEESCSWSIGRWITFESS